MNEIDRLLIIDCMWCGLLLLGILLLSYNLLSSLIAFLGGWLVYIESRYEIKKIFNLQDKTRYSESHRGDSQ